MELPLGHSGEKCHREDREDRQDRQDRQGLYLSIDQNKQKNNLITISFILSSKATVFVIVELIVFVELSDQLDALVRVCSQPPH